MITVAPESDPALLRTKLYPPRLPEDLVRREQLVERLARGGGAPVTLLSAPAGYGKSALVSDWMAGAGVPYAWFSLDEYDRSLDDVAAYLLAALQAVAPDSSWRTASLLSAALKPPPQRLADSLLLDLQALDALTYLVVDDYHTAAAPEIHQFMARLLQRLPPKLRLVLITRADPPLPLARLRGEGRLRELRGGDLRFGPDEAAQLMAQITGRPVDPGTTAVLLERTEGWPVGLRLAAMTLRRTEDEATFVRDFASAGQRAVSDYLLGEVLSHLPQERRLNLLRTAVVDRLCAPLVDALIGRQSPAAGGRLLLDELWRANFFLVALDDRDVWYRYHHLFRQLLGQELRQTLPPADIQALHRRAGHWFEEAGYIEEAIIHSLHAQDEQRAARLVEKHVHETIDREDWRRAERWLELLPARARRRPGLLATRAILAQLRYEVDTLMPLLDEAQRGLDSGAAGYEAQEATAWQGVINTYRGTGFVPKNDPPMILRTAQTAVEQVDPRWLYVRSLAEFWQVYGLQQAGLAAEGLREVRRRLAAYSAPPDVRTSRLMLAEGALHYAEGDVRALRTLAGAYRRLSLQAGHPVSLAWSGFMLGWCSYQEHDLDAALAAFTEVVEMRYQAHVRAAVDSMTGLALTLAAQGRPGEAQKAAASLRDYLLEQGIVGLLPVAGSLAWRIGGAAEGSERSAARARTAAQLAADLWELPVLTACRFDILSGDASRLAAAAKTLETCAAFARSRHAKRQLLQIGILQSALHLACGETQAALAALRETVLLGEAGGALRCFPDLGPGLAPLLRRLREQGVATAYIERVLRTYGEAQAPAARVPLLDETAVLIMGELTNREMEVLQLLAERLTNKEIAAQLHISPRTVKKHAINLYRKLDVSNRRQAVASAIELGILHE